MEVFLFVGRKTSGPREADNGRDADVTGVAEAGAQKRQYPGFFLRRLCQGARLEDTGVGMPL